MVTSLLRHISTVMLKQVRETELLEIGISFAVLP
jgi:hypothetical protein